MALQNRIGTTTLTLLGILVLAQQVCAQTAPEQEAGWVSDVLGLRHFSGMRCPDVIGAFFRTKALDGAGDRLAGCIYTGPDSMSAVLRQHLPGTGRSEASRFLSSYKASGFEHISLSGAPASGISFKTRNWTPEALCETMWYFSGKNADYTLWMNYNLPANETAIGPAVAAFTDALAQQNR